MAKISPLDLLWARRQILAGDYLGGRYFERLSRHRGDPRYAARYAEAEAALRRAGAFDIVEEVAVRGEMPRTEAGLSRLLDGLDALNRLLPCRRPRLVRGCPPVRGLR